MGKKMEGKVENRNSIKESVASQIQNEYQNTYTNNKATAPFKAFHLKLQKTLKIQFVGCIFCVIIWVFFIIQSS